MRATVTVHAGLWTSLVCCAVLGFLNGCGSSSSGSSTGNNSPITVTVTPSTVSLGGGGTQAFTASVANDSSNAGVTWSIGNGAGTLTLPTTTSVTYNAPSTVSANATVTLTATSKADASATGSSTITLTPPAAPAITSVAVACTPVTVQTGQTSQCTPTVTGTGSYSSAVTWSVGGVAGGNATVGTISSAGLYTAPAAVPSTNPVSVTATSTADTTKSGSALVTITSASNVLTVSALSETAANPFDSLTITGNGFGNGTVAISVVFTPENGDPAVMMPVALSSATSIEAMVPAFTSTAGSFSAETVDVQVVAFSATTTYLSNTIKGIPVSNLPSVPSGIKAGAMTSELISAVMNLSTTAQSQSTKNSGLSPLAAALAQLNTDLGPLQAAANKIAGNSAQTVNLTTANGATAVLNAQALAQSDQFAQALVAAIVAQGSIPIQPPSSSCPAASGNAAFDTNVCSVQLYFQSVANQVQTVSGKRNGGSPQAQGGAAEPDAVLSPVTAKELTFFSNLAFGGLATLYGGPVGGLAYSLVAGPLISAGLASLAEDNDGTLGEGMVESAALAYLDEVLFEGVPVLGTSVDGVEAISAAYKFAPPSGFLLSSGVATFAGNGKTFLDPGTGASSTLLTVPSAPEGGSFDTTQLIVTPTSTLYTLTLSTSGTGSGSIRSFPSSSSYPAGTMVALTAVPASTSTFTSWGGACSGNGACNVTMSTNKSVSATFTANPTSGGSGITGTWTGAMTEAGGGCDFSGTMTWNLTQSGTSLTGSLSYTGTLTAGDSTICGSSTSVSDTFSGSINGNAITLTGLQTETMSATLNGSVIAGTMTYVGSVYNTTWTYTLNKQ